MLKRFTPALAAALIAIGSLLTLAATAGAAGAASAGHSHAFQRAFRSGGARNGFPSGKHLAGLTNFVATLTVSTLTTVQSVHSRTNYRQTAFGATKGLVQILYHGKMYAQLGSLKQSKTVTKASTQDAPFFYGYATQLNDLFNSPVMVAKKTGSCSGAGRAGQQWDIRSTGAGNKYANLDFHVCTAKRGGYLLNVQERSKISTSKEIMSSSVKVTSIGKVPAYTPADL